MEYTKEQLWRMKHFAPDLYEAGNNALVSLRLWANEHPDDEVLTMVITQLEYALAKVKEGK